MFRVDDSEPCYEGDRFYSMMGSICRYGKLAMNDVTSPMQYGIHYYLCVLAFLEFYQESMLTGITLFDMRFNIVLFNIVC